MAFAAPRRGGCPCPRHKYFLFINRIPHGVAMPEASSDASVASQRVALQVEVRHATCAVFDRVQRVIRPSFKS